LSKNQKKKLRKKKTKIEEAKAKEDELKMLKEQLLQQPTPKEEEEDDDFLQNITKVSKRTKEALTVPVKKVQEEEKLNVKANQGLSLPAYLEALNRGNKLTKAKKKFIIARVDDWQEYVKNIK
jgi:hypothetical protein